MKILALDKVATAEAMVAIRSRLSKAGPVGWQLTSFDTPSDLLTQLTQLAPPAGETIEEIEIISEGSPVYLDAIQFELLSKGHLSPKDFGERLSLTPGVTAATVVYLSGCNSGLRGAATALHKCIAQSVANGSRTIVRGAAGYITGAHATRDEECVAEFEANVSYPNSRDARGDACWNVFRPQHPRR